MLKSSLAEGAYPARKPREAMPRTSPRMNLAPAFIVVALLSLGVLVGYLGRDLLLGFGLTAPPNTEALGLDEPSTMLVVSRP
jgi:hypothetical protein